MDPQPALPGCAPWQPSGEAWSTVPGSTPLLEPISASHSGKYLYTVGRWVEAGVPQRRAMRSSDSGSTWCVLTDSPPAEHIVASRADEATVYLELEAGPNGSPGLSRSGDAGLTWATVDNGTQAVDGLELSYTDPNVAWVRSTGSVTVTRDGGVTWSTARPPAFDQDGTGPVLTIASTFIVDPSTARRLLAVGTEYPLANAGMNRTVAYSSLDAGQTWNDLAPPPDNVEFAGLLADAAGALYLPISDGHLLRSSDWGSTWIDAGLRPSTDYALSTLGATAPGTLYILATGALWESSDAGSHWSNSINDSSATPVLALSASKLLGLDPEGLSLSSDAGRHWKHTLRTIAPASLVESPLDPKQIWALSTAWQPERGSLERPSERSDDGGLTWKIVSEIVPDLAVDGADARVSYDSLSNGITRRSEDFGQSWKPWEIQIEATAIASCVSGASCLYIASQSGFDSCSLRRTDDGGRTVSDAWDVPLSICQTEVLAVAPDSPDHLLAGCGTSVCESRDGGHHFEAHPIDKNPNRYIARLTILSNGTALAATRNVTEPGLEAPPVYARSVDGGSTWSPIVGLPGVTTNFFTSFARPGTVFALGTESNSPATAFRSDDWGATWQDASPPSNGAAHGGYDDPSRFIIFDIVDRGGGGFLASTNQGLVHFE